MEITTLKANHPEHFRRATALRVLAIDAVQAANSGHPGMPMGMADVATVLFEKHLKFSARNPNWPDRDRFVLSAGHGSMLLYALLFLTGYEDIQLKDLKNFRQLNSKTAGHPEYGHLAGIETTTGPLGQGLTTAVGLAIAESSLSSKWGKNIFNHYTYVVAGDGCLMEGISQEAISLAGKLRLNKLIVFWDNNGITIDGELSKSCITDQKTRFLASGWAVFECDGHDPKSIDLAIIAAKNQTKPSIISCKTHIGFGSPKKQDSASAHGSPLGEEEILAVKKIYGWNKESFNIPEDIQDQWKKIGSQGQVHYGTWKMNFDSLPKKKKAELERVLASKIPNKTFSEIKKLKQEVHENLPNIATRKSSELVLEKINMTTPETIGGSADLTGSNNTLTPDLGTYSHENPEGRYIYYGIREHGMAAVMNGLALHGGIIPYGGTFLVFSDYARGAIRLSALMGLRVIYVMTHDSIGLGEDGPTHQPVEHLSMMRATPNLNVYRPADAIETAESWECALRSLNTPSLICLTRQNVPIIPRNRVAKNLVESGAYIASEAESKRKVIIIATGSEVNIALDAKKCLEDEGIGTRVVSMPCWENFEKMPDTYKKKILPPGAIRIAVEAGVSHGWEKWIYGEGGNSKKGAFITIESFGASGPADELFKHFKITSSEIISKVKAILKI